MEDNAYKLYQMLDLFVGKHNYKTLYIKEYFRDDELWFINPERDIQVIRVTLDSLEHVMFDKNRIEQNIEVVKNNIKSKNIRFVDIHISKEIVTDDEEYNSVCIDTDYYSGFDLSSSFPGIKNVIHDVSNGEEEIFNIVSNINANMKASKKNKFIAKTPYLATYIIMGICILFFVLTFILQRNYAHSSALVALGADYKMFTLGIGQYYRLITVGFLHSSIIHLAMNMISLYNLGRYMEDRYGHLKFLLALFVGILGGSLTNGILTGSRNTLAVGISGGLYTLMTIYLIDVFKSGMANRNSLISIIGINLAINFMSSVAWQAHLGGAIIGILFYMIFNSDSKIAYILFLVIAIGTLSYKYINIKTINPIYSGTDMEVVEIYDDIGMKNYALKLTEKLFIAYDKYE